VVSFTYTGLSSYTTPVLLHAALVEDGVDGNTNVLRKLLWEPQGRIINDQWVTDQTRTENIDFNMNINVSDPDKLYLIVFVQDKDSKRILQTIISKAPSKVGVIVGLPDDPNSAILNGLQIYPNPASLQINVRSEVVLPREYAWKIIDQRGVIVSEGTLKRDLQESQQLDVSRLANGIYFLSIQSSDRAILYKKIAIMNQ